MVYCHKINKMAMVYCCKRKKGGKWLWFTIKKKAMVYYCQNKGGKWPWFTVAKEEKMEKWPWFTVEKGKKKRPWFTVMWERKSD